MSRLVSSSNTPSIRVLISLLHRAPSNSLLIKRYLFIYIKRQPAERRDTDGYFHGSLSKEKSANSF